MTPFKNSNGKRVCDVSKDQKEVVIKNKDCVTTIKAEGNSKLIIKNS